MKQDNKDKKKKNISMMIFILFCAVCLFLIFQILINQVKESQRKEITYSEFLTMLKNDEVDTVTAMTDGTLEITKKSESKSPLKITYYTGQFTDLTLVDRLEDAGVTYKQEIQKSSSGLVTILLYYVLPFVILYAILFFIMRGVSKGGGMMGVGKSTAKMYVQKETGVTFKDVAG